MVKQAGKKKSGTVTGIEYGRSMVRVATLSLGRGGRVQVRSLSAASEKPARPGVVEDLREARIQALKEALSKHQRDLGTVIVGASRDEVVSRFVSLPSGEAAEIRDMLFFDVERHIPFSPDDAEISYRIVEQVAGHTAAEMGGRPILHMRHFQKHGRLSDELVLDIQTRAQGSDPTAVKAC